MDCDYCWEILKRKNGEVNYEIKEVKEHKLQGYERIVYLGKKIEVWIYSTKQPSIGFEKL